MTTSLSGVLDRREDLRHHLYVRGFLITPAAETLQIGRYPFYGNWDSVAVGTYTIWHHRLQQVHVARIAGVEIFLVGHAYDPFAMEHDESAILRQIAESLECGIQEALKLVNDLTGVFFIGWVSGGRLEFLLDASGMQYACYGVIDGELVISSHMQLIGDLYQLDQDPYVQHLKSYKWYRFMMGNYLPGDLTSFRELKRVIPNTRVSFADHKFTVRRFYPAGEIAMCRTEAEYQAVMSESAQILRNTMELIARKWPRPAISLTGGVDSGTTFAAANGLYNRFSAFTYISMPREGIDAEAATTIAARFDVDHTVVDIPDANDAIPDFEIYKQILLKNAGDIGALKDNDTRKKIILMQTDLGDVEAKSWISETVRAYAYKYFGRRRMPRNLRPRHYTSLYKIFLADRGLARETDRYFADYLARTELKQHLYNYDESDMFVWEMMHGGKCGLNIGSMKFCFDITIPYNNRRLLDTLLRVKLADRLSDRSMLDLKRLLNPELSDLNIRVVNQNETRLRKFAINLYFIVHSVLPF